MTGPGRKSQAVGRAVTHAMGAGMVASCLLAAAVLLGVTLLPTLAPAQRALTSTSRIENGVAVFAALDKVTARISKLEVKLGDTVRFGALKLTPRACFSRPPTEPPKTTSFVEVQEILLDGKEQRIFSGWMFAENPGLNAVEHPVFDVWLTECAAPPGPVALKAPQPGGAQGKGQPAGAADPTAAPEEPVARPIRRPRR